MADKETSRVEAFSDGVFAIAITLLILEIRVPHLPPEAGNGALGGSPIYLLATAAAFWNPLVAFALCTGLWVLWALLDYSWRLPAAGV